MLNAGARRVAIGLHVTLTGQFKPMSAGYRPTRDGTFLSLAEMMVRGQLRLLDRKRLATEIATQLDAFVDAVRAAAGFRRRPSARASVPAGARGAARCGEGDGAAGLGAPMRRRRRRCRAQIWDYKTRILDALSGKFRELAAERGIATNPAFAGAYDFSRGDRGGFRAAVSRAFSASLPAQSVVMCHPGFVDAELERLDPLTTQREREYAYLAGDAFPGVLRAHGVALA